MRKIKITYEVVTPESAANGDVEESGWIDEEGIAIEPDQYDIDENWPLDTDPTANNLQELTERATLRAVVALAVKAIGNCVEPSDYPQCCPGHTWYTDIDPDRDYTAGAETRQSYHLEGFTDDEERAIYHALIGR